MTDPSLIGAGALAFMFFVMIAAYAVIRVANNAGWIDVFWTFGTGLTGAVAAVLAGGGSPRSLLLAALMGVWCVRLGSYIAIRVATSAEDARYTRLKELWGERFNAKIFWLIIVQAPATALLCVAVAGAAVRPGSLDAFDVLGCAIAATAIVGEGLADAQMTRFKADHANRGKVFDSGLWSWSRHPNYFFEWLFWLSLPTIAAPTPDGDLARWLSLIAPALMLVVLTVLTGVRHLEAAMERSKGDAYRAYKRKVSPFVPLPPRKHVA